jgi:DNA-3-methyladenine glycosylase II
MRRIDTPADITRGLDGLCRADPRLIAVRERAGTVPLRRVAPGLKSLCSIVIGQQVSTASAAAIFSRFAALFDPLTPDAVLASPVGAFRQAGLSAAKTRTVLALARAAKDGLDLDALAAADAPEAVARLTALPGVGPWTAELYLLFAAGHPDIFPCRDVALQIAVGEAFGLTARPGEKALALIAGPWAPWRGVAARLFWAYYRAVRGREGVADSRNLA